MHADLLYMSDYVTTSNVRNTSKVNHAVKGTSNVIHYVKYVMRLKIRYDIKSKSCYQKVHNGVKVASKHQKVHYDVTNTSGRQIVYDRTTRHDIMTSKASDNVKSTS